MCIQFRDETTQTMFGNTVPLCSFGHIQCAGHYGEREGKAIKPWRWKKPLGATVQLSWEDLIRSWLFSPFLNSE